MAVSPELANTILNIVTRKGRRPNPRADKQAKAENTSTIHIRRNAQFAQGVDAVCLPLAQEEYELLESQIIRDGGDKMKIRDLAQIEPFWFGLQV